MTSRMRSAFRFLIVLAETCLLLGPVTYSAECPRFRVVRGSSIFAAEFFSPRLGIAGWPLRPDNISVCMYQAVEQAPTS